MKMIAILLISLILLALSVSAYQFNNSDYKMTIDFVGGGVQERSGSLNTSSTIGGHITPFNSTTATYNLYEGIYYIIWSDSTIVDAVLVVFPQLILDIRALASDWVKFNWSAG